MSVICHCPDCRRATGAVPAKAVITETSTVEVFLASRESAAEVQGPLSLDENEEFVPADEVFDFRNTDLGKSFLAVYKSSPKRSRWFCSRCGTPIGYSVDPGTNKRRMVCFFRLMHLPGVIPPEWGWPKMLDIWLGTIDSSTLQEPWMAPERMLWCEKGIDWVMRYASHGAGGIPMHPLTKIDILVAKDAAEKPIELGGVQ